jgi:hypothetical protein
MARQNAGVPDRTESLSGPRVQYVSLSPGFVRIQRIVRKPECAKFFVFNNQQWCESHPLRQISHLNSNIYIHELATASPSLAEEPSFEHPTVANWGSLHVDAAPMFHYHPPTAGLAYWRGFDEARRAGRTRSSPKIGQLHFYEANPRTPFLYVPQHAPHSDNKLAGALQIEIRAKQRCVHLHDRDQEQALAPSFERSLT